MEIISPMSLKKTVFTILLITVLGKQGWDREKDVLFCKQTSIRYRIRHRTLTYDIVRQNCGALYRIRHRIRYGTSNARYRKLHAGVRCRVKNL